MATIGQYPITGVQPDAGQTPGVRQELRDLRKNDPDQFNLYMLGLQRFQTSKEFPESHPLSYFEIAGIHGLPYRPWPYEPSWNNPKGGRSNSGYCTHSSVLFLTWHRPFLALFEMQLYKHVQDAAKSYKDPALRERYVKAAKSFRMPYWDWARTDLPMYPREALKDPKVLVTIKDPETGKDIQLRTDSKTPYPSRNPLVSYPFQGRQSEFDRQEYKTSATWRSDDIETQSDKDARGDINDFPGKGRNLTERVTYILDAYDRFNDMSSNKLPKQPDDKFENYGSLEDIHDSAHGYVGGHMGRVPTSAFDPLFWLHHTNIDRLFAIWQVLHGGDGKGYSWIQPTKTNGNFWTPPTEGSGVMEDNNTELAPFYLNRQKLYTSEETRTTVPMGYVYPETKYWEVPQNGSAVRDKLRALYPEGNLIRVMRNVAISKTAIQQVQTNFVAKAEFHAQVKAEHITTEQFIEIAKGEVPAPAQVELPKRQLEDLVKDKKYLEWLVLVEGRKHALNGEYMVHFFLGAPDDSAPKLYTESPNHVAAFVPLGQAPDTGCEKCVQEQDVGMKVTGQIPLTLALAERYLAGQVGSLRSDDVVDYLKENLHWRVTLINGEPHSRANLGLLVAVGSNEVTVPDDPEAPRIFSPDIRTWPDATTNTRSQGRGEGTGLTTAVVGA